MVDSLYLPGPPELGLAAINIQLNFLLSSGLITLARDLGRVSGKEEFHPGLLHNTCIKFNVFGKLLSSLPPPPPTGLFR